MISRNSKIVVMGAGAVGTYFGGLLARAGRDVTLIGRPKHVEAISKNGLFIESENFQGYVPVGASTELNAISVADIILLCVKSPDTKKVIEDIKPYLKNDTLILSLQNGVDNSAQIKSLVNNSVFPAVVYVAVGMVGAGHVKHFGRGELEIGVDSSESDNTLNAIVHELADFLSQSNIPTTVSEQIQKNLWVKFLINCSYNGISAIGNIQYGQMDKVKEVNQLIDEITQEVLAVAKAKGIHIGYDEALAANQKIPLTMFGQISSTARDISRGKPTEIEYLNGFIVKEGLRLGVSTPANLAIYALVKMLETKKDT
jgi:2-dehydropantoate 2-reductase